MDNVNQKPSKENVDNWFTKEVSFISRNSYVRTYFAHARLMNLDTGEYAHIIVPIDEFYVEARGMGFEITRLETVVAQLPEGWTLDRCDLQLKTEHVTIDGQLDALVMESKPLHDHLKHIYDGMPEWDYGYVG